MLVSELVKAARKSFLELFENGEKFYYCVLVTVGEAYCPHVTAWSWEALERVAHEKSSQEGAIYGNFEEAKERIKWMYAESPYSIFKYDENFEDAITLFNQLPTLNDVYDSDGEDEWDKQYKFRLDIMEATMKQLDYEGIFALNQPRDEVYINVEMVYPDCNDKARAFRLNKPEDIAMSMWFEEVGQYIEGHPENLITWELHILHIGNMKTEVMKLLRKDCNIPLPEIKSYISKLPILAGKGSELEISRLASSYENIGCTVSIKQCN